MAADAFEQMKHYIGFGEQDAANLRILRDYVEPHLPHVVERFTRLVESHPSTRRILAATPEQAEQLRRTLMDWLRGLFTGTYDEAYCQRRARIGRGHVRVGLPQHFMVSAVEVVWQELEAVIHRLQRRDKHELLGSLHKLLAIETGMMVEGYRQTYSEHVRQLERAAMQSRLRESEQLARIGQLAASLAHEIKNPLAGISGAIEVIRDGLAPSNRHWPVLGEVLRQISRLDRTVKDLLIYARPKPPRFVQCDLNRVIERVVTLLREEPSFQRAQFQHVNATKLPRLEADEGLLDQLLMNLLLNAAQASDDGGLIRLRTGPQAGSLQMVVEDQGCGMSGETLERAAEPFFTTKARGTGLGLPICYKIVEAHGGRIEIDSVMGQGTRVIVDLPFDQAGAEGVRTS